MSLKSKALAGISWTIAASLVGAVMQIGYTAVMARLLDQAAFGLIASAQVVLRFGAYFSDMGLGKALQQKETLEDRDIRAAFTGGIGLGVVFFGLFYLSAPFLARAVMPGAPAELTDVIRLLALSFILTGLFATSASMLRRRLDFRSSALIEIGSYVIAYGGVGVGSALSGLGFYSLIAASLTQAVLSGVTSFVLVRHPITPIFDKAAYQPLLAYGSRMSLVSFMEFFSANLDTFLIARLAGPRVLGLYSQSFRLVQLPIQNLTTSVSRVLFPAISSIQADKPRMQRTYLETVHLMSFVIMPLCAGLSVAAPEAVLFLLGPKWAEAAPIVSILAWVVPFKLLMSFGGVICDATGRLNLKMSIEAGYILIMGALLWAVGRDGSLIHISLVILCGEIAKKTVYSVALSHLLTYRIWGQLVAGYLPALMASAFVWGGLWAARTYVWPASWLAFPLAGLVVQGALGALLLALSLALPIARPVRRQLWATLLGRTPLARSPRLARAFA